MKAGLGTNSPLLHLKATLQFNKFNWVQMTFSWFILITHFPPTSKIKLPSENEREAKLKSKSESLKRKKLKTQNNRIEEKE